MEKKINSKPLVIVAFLIALLTCGGFSVTATLVLTVLFFAFAAWQKDQDAAFSTLCALFLIILNGMIRFLFNGFEDILNQILTWADAGYKTFNTFNTIFNIIGFIIALFIVALALISVANISGGKPANTPLVSTLAAKAMGIYVPKPQPQYYAYQPTPASAPAPAPAPASAPAPAPAPAPAVTSENWTCACGTVNTGNFCTGCGKRK